MERFEGQIAITGLGAVGAAGVGIKAALEAVQQRLCCLKPIPDELTDGRGACLWGRADAFKATDFIAPLKARKLDRASQFAVAVAGQALADAGIVKGAVPATRIGIALGCGFGGISNSAEFLSGYLKEGIAGLNPMLFPNTVANAPASNVSIEYGLKGPNSTIVQRFCSAESAILAACRFIEEERADLMLAGGVDELTPLMVRGFAATGQLKRFATGFGEGCGMLLLERASHAEARKAVIKARLESISTIGLMLPGREEEGMERLLPVISGFSQITLSGAEPLEEPFSKRLGTENLIRPGDFLGRSLAMGGVVSALLVSMLAPEEMGLHLAASPEGPFFALTFRGGSPA